MKPDRENKNDDSSASEGHRMLFVFVGCVIMFVVCGLLVLINVTGG